MTDSVHIWSNDRLRIRVERDLSYENPRESQDNMATLACIDHPRILIGDKHGVSDLTEAVQAVAAKRGINIDDDYLTCNNCGGSHQHLNDDGEITYQCPHCDDDGEVGNPTFCELGNLQDICRALEIVDPYENFIFIRELYIHEHGGVTMSTAPFHCPWDSLKVGLGFVTLEKAIEEFGFTPDTPLEQVREAARKCIDAEVEEHAACLEGRVYGFICERLMPCPDDWNVEEWARHDCHWAEQESCWGFIGRHDEPKNNGMYDHWPEEYRALFDAQE